MRKRLLSLLLAALMVIGLLPAAAFAADGDTAPTVALPDGTACTVTDTGLKDLSDGYPVYKANVPQDTASITVNWAGLDTEKAYTCCGCYGYSHDGTGPITVSLSDAAHSGDETTAVDDGYFTSAMLAGIKSNPSNKMVILHMFNGANTQGVTLCVEIGEKSEGGETTEPTANTAPTLREGVNATGNKKAGYEGIAWELDLSTIFTDADGDALTYKVSIDGTEAMAADEQYSYTCGTDDVVFVFTANDGKDDSDKTYTVTMTANKKPVLKAESGSGEIATGETISLSMSTFFSGSFQDYWVSVDGGEEEYIGNNRVTFTSLAYEKPGVHTFVFRAGLDRVPYSDPCTYTLTVTGEEITNHTPYLLETAAAEAPTEPMWTGGTNTNWRPDLTKVFADEDGYDTLSFTYRDDLMTDFDTFYTGSTNPGYAVGSIKRRVGERTVTIRATDPYGAYVDYTVQITVYEDHLPQRKAGVAEAYTFEVPFGATLTLNADDYFEDVDSKDVGAVKFLGKGKTYEYTANDPANDTVVKLQGVADGEYSIDKIEFTFRTVMPESWPTLTGLTVDTLCGTANTAGTAAEGDVTVKNVSITQYDALRVADGKAAAGMVTIRVDEDAAVLERSWYELSGGDAVASMSTGASVGAELDDDITLNAATDYRNEKAISVKLPVSSEQYGDYDLTVYYDLAVVGTNARPILAAAESTKREKVTLGTAWTIDLTGLFSDADNDPLSYKVAVNGADATAIEGSTYSITPEDGVHTLVFTASDGKVDSKDTYTVTLLTRNPGAPEWPQILEYNVSSLYAYKSSTDATTYPTAYITPAGVKIVQYSELQVNSSRTYAGEIIVYVTEDIDSVGRNWYKIEKAKVAGKVSNGATGTFAPKNGFTLTKASSYTDTYRVYVTEDGQNYYYYVKVEQKNTAPTLREGVNATGNTKAGYEGMAWELDLSTVFTDADGDALTYKVSIDGADDVAADEQYSYTCGTDNVVFVFTANDGKDDSDKTYTVTMTANKKPTLKAESGSGEVATGETISLTMSAIFTDVNGRGLTYWFSVNGGAEERIGSGTPSTTTFSRAFAKAGTYTLVFRASVGSVLYSDPYTYTLTVTGDDITNHAPYLLETANAEAPTEPMWTAGTNTNWRPDLTKVFADEDGYDTLSFTYRDDLTENFSKFYTGSTQPGYAVGGATSCVGERTVTIRATDPYGAYVDYTVQITVKLNHAPVKKADAPDTLSVFVPVGLTYRLNGNDYYTDEDEKDVGNIQLVDKRYNGVGSYKATTVGDTTTVTVYGSDGGTRCNDAIEVTFTAIAVNEEKTFGVDEPYTLNVSELGLAGNLKVRVNAGVEQTIEGDTFTFIPENGGEQILHFYSDKTATAEDNYVVKITWPKNYKTWPKITEFSATHAVGAKVGDEEANPTLTILDIQIEHFDTLQMDGDNPIAGVVTITVDDDFVTKARTKVTVYGLSVTAEEGAEAGYSGSKILRATNNYTATKGFSVTTGDVTVYYMIKAVPGGSTQTFTPAIGNGSAAGTTADGVTTFPAGTGSAEPTVTLTAPASGWAVGENTFTVSCEKACVVVLKSGDTYTKLTAVNSGDAHSFTATLAEGDEIIVRLKGDVNGDGAINITDAGLAKAASLNKGSLSGLNLVCAMVSGGTSVKITDAGQIKAASLNKLTFSW